MNIPPMRPPTMGWDVKVLEHLALVIWAISVYK